LQVGFYLRQVSALLTWGAADVIQARLPVSIALAVCDEIGHVAVAVFVMGWLVPGWGVRPLIVAVLAATAIDVDHAVAAASLQPERMMQLGARPETHSLAAIFSVSLAASVLFGWRFGYAVGIGLLTHVLRDASSLPGAPLLAPFDANQHVVIPRWVLPALVGACSGVNLAVVRVRRAPRSAREHSLSWSP
jgi:membrane-bound metal-dependent hydrolase YbcI (DUF457 family)